MWTGERLKKSVTVGSIDNSFMKLDELIDQLVNIRKEAKASKHTELEAFIGCGEVSIEGERYETDAEYHKRIQSQALASETARRARKAQYEELKKEFGDE